jgi:hypothetical protein
MAFLRRKAIFAGVLGGQRKWLILGGFAWVFHWIGRIFGGGEPTARYTQEVGAGERVFVVHEPMSPLGIKKSAKKTAKAGKKAAKKASKTAVKNVR